MLNDLRIERVTGFLDSPKFKDKLNELIDKHNLLCSLSYFAEPVKTQIKWMESDAVAEIPPSKRSLQDMAAKVDIVTVIDWLIAIGFTCRCVASVPIPHPKCSYRTLCRECDRPVIEKEEETR